jgi:hypothetical protein
MAPAPEHVARASEVSASTAKERQALLQRVIWSPQITNSGRIREFLQYVCDRALQDPEAEIHEQEIGHRVFGRPASYDTSSDNVVRVTASQSRKRLQAYFESSGLAEPIVLEIPKGQYLPVFRERDLPAGEAAAAGGERQLAGYKRAVGILSAAVVVLTIALAVAVAGWRTSRHAGRSELDASPALKALWSQLSSDGMRTAVVMPDSSLSLYHELLHRQMSLAEYLNPKEWPLPDGLPVDGDLAAFSRLAAQRGFTSMASVTLAHRIGELIGGSARRVSLLRARDFNVRQMKSDNVILVGSIRANPWEELIQERLNFRFGYDQETRHAFFTNLSPQANEQAVYGSQSNVSYCRIAFVPNLAGTGNILDISGTETEGTDGGSEFVTTERSMEPLILAAGSGRAGKPAYFEALLKSSRVGGATPRLSLVALRRLQP